MEQVASDHGTKQQGNGQRKLEDRRGGASATSTMWWWKKRQRKEEQDKPTLTIGELKAALFEIYLQNHAIGTYIFAHYTRAPVVIAFFQVLQDRSLDGRAILHLARQLSDQYEDPEITELCEEYADLVGKLREASPYNGKFIAKLNDFDTLRKVVGVDAR